MPCFVSLANTKVNIVNCEFMGNEFSYTSACVFFYSDVMMSSCKFLNFKSGAVFSVANKNYSVQLKDLEVTKCGVVGIYC
jgi:hypothetical protein